VDVLRHDTTFTVELATPFEIAHWLRKGDIQAAFVSPIEYARESSEYRIVPGPAIASRTGVRLHFRRGVQDIKTMAADPSLIADLVLAKIVLAEEFELSPAIIPLHHPSLDQMLLRGDSALVSGDAIMTASSEEHGSVDLAELWSEITDLPYVHGFFCAREESLSDREMKRMAKVGRESREILRLLLRENRQGISDEELAQRDYLGRFSYELTSIEEEAVKEFIYYAHCHGSLADIPSLRFYPGAVPGVTQVSEN
jgi:predicted solute-binding protein